MFKKRKSESRAEVVKENSELVSDLDEVSFKKVKKKWKEQTGIERVLTVLKGIKKALGVIIRFFAKTLLVFFVLIFVGACLAAGYVGSQVWPYIEDYKEVAYEHFESIGPNTFSYLADTVIYDKDGNVISEINVSNYEYVDIENVSKWVQEGYIAVEDKRFKVHNGIDYKALTRAVVVMLKNGGEATQGGSTITQQVLKNGLLTQERTLKRKLIEFFLAPEFEKEYTKQEIMEFYVNTCFYGNNCYGIETASLYYFGKPSKDLTVAEAATLVGMSNNGSLYNPRKNYDLVKEKQIIVLGEMLEEGFITEEEYKTIKEEPLNLVYDRELRVKENYQTSYALHCAILALMEEEGFEFKYTFKDEEDNVEYNKKYNEVYNEIGSKVRAGGYSIYTSLDTQKQNILQTVIDESLSKYKETAEDGRYTFQGASVIVNNDTGFVEAIVGGRGTEDEFNRGFLAKRQPGSSIKPIVVYGPAFNTGLYYPSLIMNDIDDPEDKYYPKNYGGNHRGLMPIREALARSINTIAYQIMKDIGPNTGLKYLEKMKFSSLSYLDNNNTSISLGGFTYGVRVVDMAKAYSTLVNQGNFIDNTCIYKIEYQNEGVIFEEDSELISVYEPDAAYLTVDSCKGVLEAYYGTAGSRKLKNQVAMAKTGTTNDAKDVWFCGSTEYYSMAVWVGYDTPKDTGLTGSSIPGLIWNKVMTEIHNGYEKKEFEKPETVVEFSIDTEGKISKYPTNKKDIFSQALIDKAENERLALIEAKKISMDNERINDIKDELKGLSNYVIKDINALTYLRTAFSIIESGIKEIYQKDKQEELLLYLQEIKVYFELDISAMERYLERTSKIEILKQDIEREKDIVDRLNSFNNYLIDSVSDITYVEDVYTGLVEEIHELKDSNKVKKYLSLLYEIKDNKDILLKPYIEEREKELEIVRQQIEENLRLSLDFLKGITEYYEGVETLFFNFENELLLAEEKGVDTSVYRVELDEIRNVVLSMKEPEMTEELDLDEGNSLTEEMVQEKPIIDNDENVISD